VLFGGATGDTGKYSMTGETYLFNILTKTWSKLNGNNSNNKIEFVIYTKYIVKGVPPSPRAAHSSTNVE
jgi:protein phosphatase